MAFTQDFRTQRRNYNDGETRIGEKDRLWYDSNTNSIRISDGETPGGVAVGGAGGSDYVLPTASTAVKGGVKVDGTTITIANQIISGFSGNYNDLSNKPVLFDGAYASLSGKPTLFDPNDITETLVPRTDVSIDLGTTLKRWRDLYLSGNTIYLGSATISRNNDGGVDLPANSKVNGKKIAEDIGELTDSGNLLSGAGGGGNYTLPTASNSVLGGIKIGNGLGIDETGIVSVSTISYNDLSNLPTLVTSYNDLTDLPTLVTSYNDLTDKPTLFSGSYTDLTDKPTLVTSYNDLTDLPTIPSDVSDLTDNTNLLSGGGGSSVFSAEYLLTGTTTDATETELLISGSNRIPVATDKSVNFIMHIAARRTDTPGDYAMFEIRGVAANQSGTVSDIDSIFEIIVVRTNPGYLVDARADDINNTINVYVTGVSDQTINWKAVVQTIEI